MPSKTHWLTKNMKVLGTRSPLLAKQVEDANGPVSWLGKQLILTFPDGNTRTFPPLDALKQVASCAKTILADKNSLILYSGCGSGHIPREVAKTMPATTHMVVQERNVSIFAAMLKAYDCRAFLKHPRVDFAVGDLPLAPFVQGHLVRHGHDLKIAHDTVQWDLDPLYAKSVNEDLQTFLHDFQINYNTLVHFGPLFTENCLRQLPSYLTSHGVDVLKDQFAGFPAVLIGGGPSLEKNVEVLRGFKGKGVLICADTVLNYLLQRGIAPDFVCSVDPQDRTFTKYKDLHIPDATALVFHPGARHEISTTWPKDKYHTGTGMGPYAWTDWLLGKRLAIDGNIHCQIHLGANLAVHLGCTPIALVGLDLAFTGGHYHAPGGSYLTDAEEKTHVEAGLDTQDIYGQPVKTIPIFLNYRHIFETKAKELPNRYVYATEGGIGIPGVPIAALAEVLHGTGIGRYVNVEDRRRWCHHKAPPLYPELIREEGWRRVYELQDAWLLATKALRLMESGLSPLDASRRLSLLLLALRQHVAGLALLHLIASEEEQTYMHQVEDHLDRIEDREVRYEKQVARATLFLTPIVTHSLCVRDWLRETLLTLGEPVPRQTFNVWKKTGGLPCLPSYQTGTRDKVLLKLEDIEAFMLKKGTT